MFDTEADVALDRAAGHALRVGIDHVAGATLAQRHLLDLGHEAVVRIGGPEVEKRCTAVDWYNTRRLHSSLGYVAPVEFETAH